MKHIQILILGFFCCILIACHNNLWSAIDELETRVTRLEELCKEMNTNITSLQTIVNVLQTNDFITGVVEIKKDGAIIGYTITFDKHEPITLYHGQDGENGNDGSTPIIGLKQHTDGLYYWTLNGEWLLDDNGNKLPVSGKDGQDGTNGSNGKDGVTPVLKIEDGHWYISYDNGTSWTLVGKATGEDGKDGEDGEDGKDGQKGDSMFQAVTQDEHFVYFTLADGNVIRIPKGQQTDKKVDLVMFMGQSNMVGRGVAAQSTVVGEGHGYEFRAISDPTQLYPVIEPFGLNENHPTSGVTDSGRTGSLVSAFIEEYYKYRKTPIVGVSCSVGGTATSFWAPGKAPLNDAIERHNAAKTWLENNGYTIEHDYMVWLQGEGDAKANISADQYASNLTAIIEEMIDKAGLEFCALIRIGHFKTSQTRNQKIIYSQTQLCKSYDKAVMVSTLLAGCLGDQMKDLSHYTQPVYNKVGKDAGSNTAYYINTGKKPSMYDPEYDNYFPYGDLQRKWQVTTHLGEGAEYIGANVVLDNEPYCGIITLSEGYSLGSYSITMNNTSISPTIEDKKMTITIAHVTGDIQISLTTINDSTGESSRRIYTIGEKLRFTQMEEVASTKIVDQYYSDNSGMLSIANRAGYRSWKNIPLYAGEQYQLNPQSSLVVFYDSNEHVISTVNIRNTYGSDGIMPVIEQDCYMSIAMSNSFVPKDEDCTITRIK